MPILETLIAAAAPALVAGLMPRPKPQIDPLQQQLMAEQLAQLQMWKSLAPLMSSQNTLAGIAQARESLEAMLRQLAQQAAGLGLIDSESLNRSRGSALAQFGEAVARLRQQQPMLMAQLLQGAQSPMQVLQQLAGMRQAVQQQADEQFSAHMQALGQAFGYVLPEVLKSIPRPRKQVPNVTYSWNPPVSLRLQGSPFAPTSWEQTVRNQLRW